VEKQFNKIPISYLQKLTRQIRSQEQTLEVRLPDGMPDIGRVLCAWGQAIVRGKEWNSDNMTVSCGVMAWVLYMPEEGEEVCAVEAWLPYSMKWELPDTMYDGKILVSCLLRGIDARSISARKLMLRATLSALGEGWLPGELQVAVPGEISEGIELLTADYPVVLPREAGEKAFLLEEQLTMPATGPKPEKLMYYSLKPEILDKKVMAGKVVFRGSAVLHLLYRGEDGQIYTYDWDLPFSQYADLEGEYDQEASVTVYPCVTSLDLTMLEDGALQLKAGILGQYMLCDRCVITLAEDAYSPNRKVELVKEELRLPAILDRAEHSVLAEQTVQADVRQIVDVVFLPEHGQIERTEEGVRIAMPGQFQMLYYDPEGQLRSVNSSWEGEWELKADEDCAVDAVLVPAGKTQAAPGAGNVNLRAEMNAEAVSTSGQVYSMLSGMEIGEQEKPNPGRPSLVLCRKGNRRLWDVAKSTGSTVSAIMEANGLDGEPEERRVLLIPVI